MVSQLNFKPKQIFFLIFLSLFLAIALTAQTGGFPSESLDTGLGGGNSITGTVLSPSGQRLSARIRIRLATMTRGDTVTTTDDNGNFSFRGLPSGNYTLVIDKERDYEPLAESVDIIQLRGSPPQAYNLNVRLKFKKSAGSEPEVISSELAGVPKRAVNFYKKAAEFARKKDHRAAIERLRLAISAHPEFVLAHNELGVQFLQLNELEQADEAFRAALKIDPQALSPLTNRGLVLVQMKRFEDAAAIFREVVKIKEESAVGHYFLGQALANLGRFDEAEKELVSAIKLGGDEMNEARRILAIIYNVKGDKKRAVSELETYLRVFPKASDAEQLRQVVRQLGESSASPPPSPETKPAPQNPQFK